MPVMSILSSLAYTQPPAFSHVERKRFCDFPASLLAIADTLRSPTNRVGFLLSCAYFRATKRFFPVQDSHQHDIANIAQRGGLIPQQIDLRRYDKQPRIRHQQRIRTFYGFTLFDAIAQMAMATELRPLIQAYLSPKQIFYRLVDVLINSKIAPPSYAVLRTFIGEALTWACKIKCVPGYHHGFITLGGLMTKKDTDTTTDALLDDLWQDCDSPEDILGEHGLLKGVTKRLVERARHAELMTHLGYAPHVRTKAQVGNTRKGTSAKTVQTEQGPVELTIPRDRADTFEPTVVKKRQRRLEGFDDKVLTLDAHGLTTRELQSHLEEL